MEQATANYEQHAPLASAYLAERGLDASLASTYRLGVVVEPEIGHELYIDRLSIPYLTRAGVVYIKFACMDPDHGDHKDVDCPKYLNLGGSDTHIYNVGAFFNPSTYIAMAEGEFDTQVLDHLCDVPAVGIPGVQNWKPHYERCFQDYERVFLFADGDSAGRDFAKHVQAVLETVTVVQMPPDMDVNSIYLAEGPEGLRKRAGL